MRETYKLFKCPKCDSRGDLVKLEEADFICPVCGANLSYMSRITKRYGLHKRIRSMLKQGLNPTQISRILPCSKTTVYKVKNKIKRHSFCAPF